MVARIFELHHNLMSLLKLLGKRFLRIITAKFHKARKIEQITCKRGMKMGVLSKSFRTRLNFYSSPVCC